MGDGLEDDPERNPIDLSPDALARLRREIAGPTDRAWLHKQTGGICLEEALLDGAIFDYANLEGAWLWKAQMRGASLRRARLDRAVMRRADLREVNVMEARLNQTDLFNSRLESVFWYGAHLEHTRLNGEDLRGAIGDELSAAGKRPRPADYDHPSYQQAREAYLSLKTNFLALGRYEDASWAYVKEQQMEKMTYFWEWRSSGWRIWRVWSSLWRWARNWIYELTTGYGEGPWRPLACGAAMILLFALGFWLSGAVTSPGDALMYSLATFATFNLARPELNPQGAGVEAASSVEALLGIGVLALFVFTLGNRMSRG